MAVLHAEDYNGDLFVLGGAGEAMTDNPRHTLHVPTHNIAGVVHMANRVNDILVDSDASTSLLSDLVVLNMFALAKALYPAPDNVQWIRLYKISYLRALAFRAGLSQPEDQAVTHHCLYREYRAYSCQEVRNDPFWTPAYNAAMNARTDAPMVQWRTEARRCFSNLVCLVAFMFRVRGHHFLENMTTRYDALFGRMRTKMDNIGISWEDIAVLAFHHIYPDTLDAYWVRMARDNRIDGLLIKRVNAAAAGTALFGALKKGIDDLRLVFPGVVDPTSPAWVHLNAILDELSAPDGRWKMSVNAHLYNARPMIGVVNEDEFGSLSSVLRGALMEFANEAPLLKSAAITRVAGQAPITGAVVSRLLHGTISSPAVVASFADRVSRGQPTGAEAGIVRVFPQRAALMHQIAPPPIPIQIPARAAVEAGEGEANG